MDEQTPAERLSLWSDKLRDFSSSGLRFASNIYDKENYQKVQDIAVEMLALAGGEPIEEIEPLRTPHFLRATPLSAGDAAVIDEHGSILLIRRADNQMWAMPGGMLEVGESPAEGVVRETLEETGVCCAVKSFLGIFDSRLTGGKSRFQLYHFTFLCEPVSGKLVEPAIFAHETLGFGWFAENELPDPIDPGHSTRIPKAFQMWRGGAKLFLTTQLTLPKRRRRR